MSDRPIRSSSRVFRILILSCLLAAPTARAQIGSFFDATELLGRPTDRSVVVHVVPSVDMDLYVEYGPAPGPFAHETSRVTASAHEPTLLELVALSADTRYAYRLRFRPRGQASFAEGAERGFHTRRASGSPFVFDLLADSHLGTDKHNDPDLYRRTLLNVAEDQPDFVIDLGDTFRATKVDASQDSAVVALHLNQRGFFGLFAHSAPLFLAIGNHEEEWGWLLDGTADNVAVRAARSRTAYYPNPVPDAFYTGDERVHPFVGLHQGYYAFEWGDALFVVLDPYWYTPVDPKASGSEWDWTLGDAQYAWLDRTLGASDARFKFVFSHHVLGLGRGGIERATLYEWGGRDQKGTWLFDTHRPTWRLPIHQLMLENGVTAYFQGHDHLFARQELDGIAYVTVPMPADYTFSTYNQDAYLTGDTRPNAGHVRVSVSPAVVTVSYERAFLPKDEVDGHVNGEVAYAFSLEGSAATSVHEAHVPAQFVVEPAYPNPFRGTVNVPVTMPRPCTVRLEVYDLIGRLVAETGPIPMAAGRNTIRWDSRALPGGVYPYRVSDGSATARGMFVVRP